MEKPFGISREQQSPIVIGDLGRLTDGVVSGEGHAEGVCATRLQVGGSDGAVVDVRPVPPGYGYSQHLQNGGDYPPGNAEPGMALANIMQEGGSCQVFPLRKDGE